MPTTKTRRAKTTATTELTITTEQILALQTEAAQHGDDAQVRLCRQALDGNEVALRKCAKAIDDARAMDDSE
jgi:flagellar basal body rod protein FlgB